MSSDINEINNYMWAQPQRSCNELQMSRLDCLLVGLGFVLFFCLVSFFVCMFCLFAGVFL